jgi:hypothetical protein
MSGTTKKLTPETLRKRINDNKEKVMKETYKRKYITSKRVNT